jgi:putative endonuclease
MAFTYILECSDGSYYVGSTVDLERRIAQHAAGEGAAYTRRRPVKLAWAMQMDSVAEAYLLEKKLQGWSRAKRRCVIEGRYGDLRSNMKDEAVDDGSAPRVSTPLRSAQPPGP